MICGENGALKALDDAKAAIQEKIGEGKAALAELQAQAESALASLQDIKIEIPELPNLQEELIKLQSEATNGLAFTAKLADIKEKFGEVVEDLDDKIQELGLNEFPPSFDFDDIKAKICAEVPNKQINQSGAVVDKAPEPKEAVELPKDMTPPPQPVKPSVETEVVVRDTSKPIDYSAPPPTTVSTGSQTLREIIFFRESSGDYTNTKNPLGYVGGYQFGRLALIDLKYIKETSPSGNSTLKIDSYWTGKNGIRSLSDFLNNPEVQDSAFDAYAAINKNRLKNSGVITDATTAQEINGFLAAAHLIGAGGVSKYRNDLSSPDAADGFDTRPSEYYELGLKAKVEEGVAVKLNGTYSLQALKEAFTAAGAVYSQRTEDDTEWYHKGMYSSIYSLLPGAGHVRTPIKGWPLKDMNFNADDIPSSGFTRLEADNVLYESWKRGRLFGDELTKQYKIWADIISEEEGVAVGDFREAVTLYNGR